jgi:hypothetical protein
LKVDAAPLTPTYDLRFPHRWQAEVLAARPLILPPRHFVYPREAEEVERGALEVMVSAKFGCVQPFLATCQQVSGPRPDLKRSARCLVDTRT